MKWSAILLLCALALLASACEKHPASKLPAEHATEFGKYVGSHDATETHAAKPGGEHAPAKSEAAAPAHGGKPGEAPKFFPEKK